MKTLSIATQKGGVGKTTTALEVAAAMSIEYGLKVLLVDFDQQQNLSTYVGVDPEECKTTIYDALHDPEKIHDAIIHLNLFDYIPGTSELSKCDVEFINPEDLFNLDDALDLVKDNYDYAIIDNGPQRGKTLQMTYVASDYIVAPCDDTKGGFDGIAQIHHDVERLKGARTPLSSAVIIGAVLIRYKPNTIISKTALDILTSIMGQINSKGFVMYVRETVKPSEAKLATKSMQEYAPYCNTSLDYKEVTKAILEYAKGDK